MTLVFVPPPVDPVPSRHHVEAAAANVAVVDEAVCAMDDALSGAQSWDRILLRAAAGAGKSYALVHMVEHALRETGVERVAVTAFQNRQVQPLARRLAGPQSLGRDAVALLASARTAVPDDITAAVTVVRRTPDIPDGAPVVVSTAHRLGAPGERNRLREHLGTTTADEDKPFDVLFIDESWQMSEHLFARVRSLARLIVGVGDVGQLPPLDPGENPWRGDPGYNPYRAWPTGFEGEDHTWTADLPTVWRPTAEQLQLWRAFYSDWDELHCVAAPGDRSLETSLIDEPSSSIWQQIGTGQPTLLEVEGLPEPDSPDVDLPLLGVAESLLDDLLRSGLVLRGTRYDPHGAPSDEEIRTVESPGDEPLIVLLATRNQAVDDAQEVVDRLMTRHGLAEGVIRASTVDRWQGQTNGITVAIHPLSGAAKLDEFNSAFGRLAVACTRASHGLLLLARAGIDELLADAPARPGTPFGEPGPRSLPRQTHKRIIDVMARGTLDAAIVPPASKEGSLR